MKLTKKKIKEAKEIVQENGLMDYGGLTVKDFCKLLDISRETFYIWSRRKDEFFNTIEKAKKVYKSNLELKIVKSLAKAAKGYRAVNIKKEFLHIKGQKKVIKEEVIEKDVAPNVGAAIFLLTNLNPLIWKNRQYKNIIEEKTEDEENLSIYNIEDLSDDTIIKIANELQNGLNIRRLNEKNKINGSE